MAVDYTKIQMTSAASSNKVLLEGSGSFVIPALPGSGDVYGQSTIPHGFSSDNLLWQVWGNISGVFSTTTPWMSPDGRVEFYASLNGTNLYITGHSSDISGFGAPSYTVNYSYRILIP